MTEYILQLSWNDGVPPWREVARGSLEYCRRVQAEGVRFTGETRIVKLTTITEVIV